MAVEWIDSCQVGTLDDNALGPILRGYGTTGTNGRYTSSGGRYYLRPNSGGANQNSYRDLTANATYTLNGRLMLSNVGADGSAEVAFFNDGATRHFDVRVDTAGALFVTRNGTTLETGAASAFVSAVPRWVSVRVTIGDAGVGSYEVWIDGVLYINNGGASADTRNAGTAQVTRLGFGPIANPSTNLTHWGDIIICSGSQIIGDSQVDYLPAAAAGNSAQWTPSTGSNYQNVDETAPNDDTDYNVDNVSGHKDTFANSNLTLGVSTVVATQELTRARKDAAGALSIRQLVRVSSTDYDNGSDIALSTAYTYYYKRREVSPATSVAWTETEINALESGYKVA